MVSMSDSESVGPGSIPGKRVSNFFLFFSFFLLEVNKLFFFFFLISKSNDISSYSMPYKRDIKAIFPLVFTSIHYTSYKPHVVFVMYEL